MSRDRLSPPGSWRGGIRPRLAVAPRRGDRFGASPRIIGRGRSVAASTGDQRRPRGLLGFDVLSRRAPHRLWYFTLRRDGTSPRSRPCALRGQVLGLRLHDHQNRERWRDGCLKRIDSHRLERQGVSRRRSPGRRQLRGRGAIRRQRLAAIGSFAYWDKRKLLGRERLLNPQTGDYLEVVVVAARRFERHGWCAARPWWRAMRCAVATSTSRSPTNSAATEWVALDRGSRATGCCVTSAGHRRRQRARSGLLGDRAVRRQRGQVEQAIAGERMRGRSARSPSRPSGRRRSPGRGCRAP